MDMQIVVINGKEHTVPANWSDEKIISHFKSQHAESQKANKNPSQVKKDQKRNEDIIANQVKNIEQGKAPEGKPQTESRGPGATGYYGGKIKAALPEGVNKSNLLRYGVKDPLAGAFTTINNVLNKISPTRTHGREIIQKNPDYYKIFGVENPGMADKFVGAIPEYAASYLIPALRAESVLSNAPKLVRGAARIAGEIAPQSAYTAATSDVAPGSSAATTAATMLPFSIANAGKSANNPFVRGASLLASSGLSGLFSHMAAKQFGASTPVDVGATTAGALIGLATKGRSPKGQFYRETVEDLNRHAKPGVLEAFERQGQHAYPYETTFNPVSESRFHNANYTPEQVANLAHVERQRVSAHGPGMDELAQAMYDKMTHGKSKSHAYATSLQGKVPRETQQMFKTNEVLKELVDKATNDAHFKQVTKGMAKDSVGYYDELLQRFDKVIDKGSVKGSPEYLGTKELSNYKRWRNEIDSAIKEANPRWDRAKRIARREIMANELKAAWEGKEKSGYTLKEFFDDPKNVKGLRSAFKNDQRTLAKIEDWITISQNLQRPQMRSIANRSLTGQHTEKLTPQNPNQSKLIEGLIHKFSGSRGAEEAFRLLVNPRWDKEARRLAQAALLLNRKVPPSVKKGGRVVAHGTGKVMNELHRQEED